MTEIYEVDADGSGDNHIPSGIRDSVQSALKYGAATVASLALAGCVINVGDEPSNVDGTGSDTSQNSTTLPGGTADDACSETNTTVSVDETGEDDGPMVDGEMCNIIINELVFDPPIPEGSSCYEIPWDSAVLQDNLNPWLNILGTTLNKPDQHPMWDWGLQGGNWVQGLGKSSDGLSVVSGAEIFLERSTMWGHKKEEPVVIPPDSRMMSWLFVTDENEGDCIDPAGEAESILLIDNTGDSYFTPNDLHLVQSDLPEAPHMAIMASHDVGDSPMEIPGLSLSIWVNLPEGCTPIVYDHEELSQIPFPLAPFVTPGGFLEGPNSEGDHYVTAGLSGVAVITPPS